MEKNALIAIVLSVAVLFLWSLFYAPKHVQKTPLPSKGQVEHKAEETQAQAINIPQENMPKEASASAKPGEKQPRDVIVETNLIRAVFSERLGALKSFQLKQYKASVAENAPLLDLNNEEQANLFLSLNRHSVPGFDEAVFEADTLNLDLTKKPGTGTINFKWSTPEGLTFIRTYVFRSDSYEFSANLTLENRSQNYFEDNVEYNIIEHPFEKISGVYNTEGMVALNDDSLLIKETKKIQKEELVSGNFTWVGYQDNYFLAALVPWEPLKTNIRLVSPQKDFLKLTVINPPLKVAQLQKATIEYKAYIGPKELRILKSIGHKLDRAVYFGWFDIIGKPLLYFLNFIYSIVHNYGVAIILLTFLIKILFWPLTQKSYKSMKAMQKLQPHMAKIREKYKDNREKLNQEMMNLYKTYKVNPMGGCLPMIIQIPVFFALYRLLAGTIELRQAPFMLWIKDLSAPDRLNVGFDVPYLGGLPVLTLLMGASMFIQQKMTPTSADPTQAKIMMLMPIIFTFMFINFPAGLVLYWLVNNLLSIGQQYLINKSK